jgi:hypothetical protein
MRYFFVGLTLLFGCSVFGQEHRVKQFSVDDGLPSSHVYEVKQDKQGFYWIATDQGLVKYDGYSFEKQPGPFAQDIWWTHQDNDGRIWGLTVGTRLWYLENDSMRDKPVYFQEATHINIAFAKIFQDRFNRYWLQTSGWVYTFKGDSFNSFTLPSGLGVEPKGSLPEFRKNKNQRITLVTKCPLTVWQPDSSGRMEAIFEYSTKIFRGDIVLDLESPVNDMNTTFVFNSYDSIYTITNGLITAYISGQEIKMGAFPSADQTNGKSHYRVIRIGDKYAFIHSSGSFITDKEFNHLSEFDFLQDYKVNTVYLDNENSIWISTADQGLIHLVQDALASKSYSAENLTSEVISIEQDDDSKIWVAYKNGNVCLLDNGELKCFSVEPKDYTDSPWLLHDFNILVNHLVLAVGFDEMHVYKIGSDIFDSPGPKIIRGLQKIKAVSRGTGSLFVTDYVDSYQLKPDVDATFKLSRTRSGFGLASIGKENEGFIFSTRLGLFHISDLGDSTLIHEHVMADNFELDNSQNVWIRHKGMGLSRIVKNKLVTVEALKNQLVRDLFFEGDSILWAATNEGLLALNFNPRSGNYEFQRKLTRANGLLTNDVTAIHVDQNSLYVGTSKGLNVINRNKLSSSASGHRVFLTNATSKENNLGISGNYDLEPENNSLQLEYVYISPKSAGQVVYEYKLDGIDTKWKKTSETSINYPFLPVGDYRFQLRAKDINGIASVEDIDIRIHVQQYWWKTTWFIVLAISCFVILTILLFVLRIKQLNARAKEKTEVNNRIAELRLNALQSQMNPHFVFNVLNSIQEGFLTNKIEEANQYMSDFAKLMRLFLESSDDKFILLSKEINLLTHYVELERMRLDNKFQYNFELHQEIDTDEFKVPTMLLQPIIENAILHGLRYKKGAGNLDVKFSLLDNTKLVITITDNGVGRKKSAEINSRRKKSHNSKATGIINERISIINSTEDQRIQIKYTDLVAGDEALGTSVELSLDLEINR